jgi:hypothetical protein
MNSTAGIIIAISALACIYIIKELSKPEVTYEKARDSGREYLVQNFDDKVNASEMLDVINNRIKYLVTYLKNNIDKYPEYAPYITRLVNGTEHTKLTENTPNGKYTSYTLNKGEEIALCLRYKETGQLHDINLVMYVVLHELSHIACPELNHTPLFKKIFIFLLKIAFMLKIYRCVDYRRYPEPYCNGMIINESLVDCSNYETGPENEESPYWNQYITTMDKQLGLNCPSCVLHTVTI